MSHVLKENRNGGDLNVKASTWDPITGLSEESIIRPPRQSPEAEMGPPITMTRNSGDRGNDSSTEDSATRLQLLIQHCSRKAKEAIESCVILPVGKGYITAKNTMKENFGKPHIIAKAHIKKLESLLPLKQADGPSLLEYARNLEIAHRTFSSMGLC